VADTIPEGELRRLRGLRWGRVYCTTYCNQDHAVHDGVPIEHNCYVLPWRALIAEIEQNFDQAIAILSAATKVEHRGRRI
jgi:hypothetical protein